MSRFLTALVLLAALAPAAPVPKRKAVQMYPTAVGTKWEYVRNGEEENVNVEEITESEEKDGVTTLRVDITTGTGAKQFEAYKIEKGELLLTAGTNGTYDPPMLIRKAEMKEGDVWETEYGINGNTYKMTLTVGKAEEITTPAGKYTTHPITRAYANPRGIQLASEWWYVDGVGMVLQTSSGKPAQELKAFTEGKK
jgi:hypothetical protein